MFVPIVTALYCILGLLSPTLHASPLTSIDNKSSNALDPPTNQSGLGTLSTIFENIISARLHDLEQAFGPIDLQLIIAYPPSSPANATASPEGFTTIMVVFVPFRTGLPLFTQHESLAPESHRWSQPISQGGTQYLSRWRWVDRTSTLAAQLDLLRQKEINEEYVGLMVWSVPNLPPGQVYWTFSRQPEGRPPAPWTQGDRDHRLYEIENLKPLWGDFDGRVGGVLAGVGNGTAETA